MAGVFRSNVFDPILIVCQMVAIQCFFYVSLGVWIVVANVAAGMNYSVDKFFDYHVSTLKLVVNRRICLRVLSLSVPCVCVWASKV